MLSKRNPVKRAAGDVARNQCHASIAGHGRLLDGRVGSRSEVVQHADSNPQQQRPPNSDAGDRQSEPPIGSRWLLDGGWRLVARNAQPIQERVVKSFRPAAVVAESHEVQP